MTTSQQLSAFLNANRLEIDEQHHSITTGNAPPAGDFVTVLSYYGFLAIQGPDTASFLQGQTTCDVSTVDNKNSCNGAYCNPKGRMLSSFQLAQTDSNHYLLRMRRPLVESTQSVFSKYIVFSKAEQHNANDDYTAIGLYGKSAKARIIAAFGNSPDQRNTITNKEKSIAIQIDTDGLMFECWIANSQLNSLWPILSDSLALAGSKHWELLTIRQGLGEVTEATQEMFIPQMLNYQITGAVSFNKGCYTGQEVVARMEYRGKLKRPMYRITTSDLSLSPGSDLYGQSGEQSIGNIVNIINIDDKVCEALAVITSKDVEQNSVFTANKKASLEVLPLPYAINREGE